MLAKLCRTRILPFMWHICLTHKIMASIHPVLSPFRVWITALGVCQKSKQFSIMPDHICFALLGNSASEANLRLPGHAWSSLSEHWIFPDAALTPGASGVRLPLPANLTFFLQFYQFSATTWKSSTAESALFSTAASATRRKPESVSS